MRGGGPGQRDPWELGPTDHFPLGALLSGPSARLTATPEGIQDKIASSLSHPAAPCRPAIKESSGDPSARLCATPEGRVSDPQDPGALCDNSLTLPIIHADIRSEFSKDGLSQFLESVTLD